MNFLSQKRAIARLTNLFFAIRGLRSRRHLEISQLISDGFQFLDPISLADQKEINEELLQCLFQLDENKEKEVSFSQAMLGEFSGSARLFNPHLVCPTIEKLSACPRTQRLVQLFFSGFLPRLASSQVWILSPKASGDASDYGLHYDIDSYGFLKCFYYLTDPADTLGIHEYVRGSHRDLGIKKLLNRRRPKSDFRSQITEVYSDQGAGQGFIENTFGYHAATLPQRPRLMLQFVYTTSSSKLG